MTAATVPAPTTGTRPAKWRTVVAWILLVVGITLVPLSGTVLWLRNFLLKKDRYVETITPLAQDPAIQQSIAAYVTNELFTNVDVQAEVKDALPPKAQFLAAPIANGLRQLTYNTTLKIVQSPQFQTTWVRANRLAHDSIVALLTGDTKRQIKVGNGTITLDLTPVIEKVSTKLESTGVGVFQKIPFNKISQFQLFQSKDLATYQKYTKFFDRLAYFLPLLAIACLAGAILVAHDRRRAVFRVGMGIVLAMIALAVILVFARSRYVDAITTPQITSSAALAVWKITFRFYRNGVLVLLALGAVLAIGAAIAGPSRGAQRVRALVGSAGDRAGSAGLETGAFGRWVARSKVGIEVALCILAFILLFMKETPRPRTVFFIALLLVLAVLAVEVIARASASGASDDAQPVMAGGPSGAVAPGDDASSTTVVTEANDADDGGA